MNCGSARSRGTRGSSRTQPLPRRKVPLAVPPHVPPLHGEPEPSPKFHGPELRPGPELGEGESLGSGVVDRLHEQPHPVGLLGREGLHAVTPSLRGRRGDEARSRVGPLSRSGTRGGT